MKATRSQKLAGQQGSQTYYALEQEKQPEADHAVVAKYYEAWKGNKGVGHAICTHIKDSLWWLQHICGVNMLDYEEKVVVLLVFAAVVALIVLGAYKQGTQLVRLLQQLATDTRS